MRARVRVFRSRGLVLEVLQAPPLVRGRVDELVEEHLGCLTTFVLTSSLCFLTGDQSLAGDRCLTSGQTWARPVNGVWPVFDRQYLTPLLTIFIRWGR